MTLAWAAVAVYVVGWLACWRPMFRWAWREATGHLGVGPRTWCDVIEATFVASCVALGWPIIVALALIGRAGGGTPSEWARRIGGT